ncbi:MAG: phosphodiester glycosidase family protein [Clostridia bacterium]|nr:phosphodiester glycosidase family protein [Clostridia bacterium]
MKNVLRAMALALLLLSLLLLVPSGALVGQAEIIELPIDAKKDDLIAPYDQCYLSDWEYEDPSISVKIEEGRMYDTTYLAARIKIANATQIRAALSGNYTNLGDGEFGRTQAKKVSAVFAISGDSVVGQMSNIGLVTRQGKNYRTKCDKTYTADHRLDVLIIDEKGDFHILKEATNADIEAFSGTIVNGFTFGPALVIDGVRQTDFIDAKPQVPMKLAQRMCIAQVGPLEYMCIYCEGPENKGSKGLTLEQFAELVSSFKDIQNAYNLDGGNTCNVIFKRDGKYEKINGLNNPKVRRHWDIIYFSSAYLP